MKLVKYCLSAIVALTVVLAPVSVVAQDFIMTDEHIARIKSNCKVALGTIATLHVNDAPTYVNRNQTYFSIGDKMMARLNSRLSINRFDASELVRITSDYDNALHEFRLTYKQYYDAMAEVLRMDCTKQPVSFYDLVSYARERRASVNQSVKRLNELIHEYQNAVQTFRTEQADKLRGADA